MSQQQPPPTEATAPAATTEIPPAPQPTYHTEVDAVKLWIGGLVTAVIASFTGIAMLQATGDKTYVQAPMEAVTTLQRA